jgi:hypothetical protein
MRNNDGINSNNNNNYKLTALLLLLYYIIVSHILIIWRFQSSGLIYSFIPATAI